MYTLQMAQLKVLKCHNTNKSLEKHIHKNFVIFFFFYFIHLKFSV